MGSRRVGAGLTRYSTTSMARIRRPHPRTETRNGNLVLAQDGSRPPIQLVPLNPAGKVQWDPAARTPRAAGPDEAAAYAILVAETASTPGQHVTVTGPLLQSDAEYQLEVRIVQR